ncbi:MAG TPA: DNA methyltransferase [Bacilli bacterium]|nr:DNA methyltransferase [Bacilli bacterium]
MAQTLEKSRNEILREIDKRVDDKIIEKGNAELLKKLIIKAENLTEAISIAELGTTYKRTGLHFDRRLEKFGDTVKFLKRNEQLSFKVDENAINHKLIVGDNYDALLNLLVEYRGKIDVIYIDPPYGKDNMGEFAETNYDNTLTRDNLLSMLYPRLVLARQLMSENGIICCSIDDRNQAYVRCLFDDVFGESNFIGTAPRKTRGSATTKGDAELQTIADYVHIYSNNKSGLVLNKKIVGMKKYPHSDARGKFYVVPLQDNGPHGTRTARPNLYYPIYLLPDGTFSYEEPNNYVEKILPKRHKNDDGRWMWSKKKFDKDKNDLIFMDNKMQIKHYYSEEEDQNKYQYEKLWFDEFQNSKGTIELGKIIGKGLFDNPKPVELVAFLINLASDENSIVLDFFAGSGTTGQAVLELNKKDGGNRQFILATSNEITPKTPNGVVIDVTSKRLKRIMTGECYDKNNQFEWNDKNKPYGGNLEVYDISSIANFDITIFDQIDETLYGQPKLSIQEKTKWVCENLEGTQKFCETDKNWKKRQGASS